MAQKAAEKQHVKKFIDVKQIASKPIEYLIFDGREVSDLKEYFSIKN